MSIGFSFRTLHNDRTRGSDKLHYNAQYTVLDLGSGTAGFELTQPINDPVSPDYKSWLPLDVSSPDYRRINIRITPDVDATLLTETLVIGEVIAGSNKFYCTFATGSILIDPLLIGTDVYATFNGPDNPLTDTLTVPVADIDNLCRVVLTEIPLQFNIAATADPRHITVTASTHGALTETVNVTDVVTVNTKFYVEYDNGRITVNHALVGETLTVTYYGSGSVILANDINELHTAFTTLDSSIVEVDGSNSMTGNLDMDGNNIVFTHASTGIVDSLHIYDHDHTGPQIAEPGFPSALGVKLDGNLAFTAGSFITANLNSKISGDPGAVGTGNIQNNAITNVELASDKASLSQVSAGTLVIGGPNATTVGIGMTPLNPQSGPCLLEMEFMSYARSKDKILLHDSGGPSGKILINIDDYQNINIVALDSTKISFRAESAIGTEYCYMDPTNGRFVVNGSSDLISESGDINTQSGKLCENYIPLIPSGTKTVFYAPTVPNAGWIPVVGLNDYALRIVVNGSTGGTSYAGSAGFVGWFSAHTHTITTHGNVADLSHIVSGYTGASTFQMGTGASRETGGPRTCFDRTGFNNHTHYISFDLYGGYPTANNSTSTSAGPNVRCSYADIILAEKV